MAKNQNAKYAALAVVCIILGAVVVPMVLEYMETGTLPIGGSVTGQVAPHKFTLTKRGTSTAVEAATVYAWYDWNSNGAVDLGEYPEGEIETLQSAASTGLVTTGVEYPLNKDVLYQVHMAAYNIETFARKRVSLPAAHDGSALVVPSVFLTLTDAGATRISMNGELLVTTTGTYSYGASGAEPTCEVVHTAATADAGIGEAAYTHWGTGKTFAGSVLIITYANQDFIDLKPDSYSGIFIGPSTTTVWYNTAGYFNDGDVTGDERFSMFFNLDITAIGDLVTIGLHQGIELSDLAIGISNTAIGTPETDIKVVA